MMQEGSGPTGLSVTVARWLTGWVASPILTAIGALERKVDDVMTTLQQLLASVSSLVNSVRSLVAAVATATDQATRLSQDVVRLTTERDNALSVAASFQGQITGLQSQVAQLQAQLNSQPTPAATDGDLLGLKASLDALAVEVQAALG